MKDPHLDLDREGLTHALTRAMTGRSTADVPVTVSEGPVKTYALEVNQDGTDTFGVAKRLAGAAGMTLAHTQDPNLSVLTGDATIFLDTLDDRFWLFHTTSLASEVQRLLKSVVWKARYVDWCWFPAPFVREMLKEGEARWFKTDFGGDDFLPVDSGVARRFKAQLEAESAAQLFDELLKMPLYQQATSLTAVAMRLTDGDLGVVDEAAHFRGRFIGRGDTFELHLGFVSKMVDRYAEMVRAVEKKHGLSWTVSEEAIELGGEVLHVPLDQPITDLHRFSSALFACREPFRLWAIPRFEGDDYMEAEAVDLHVGGRLRVEATHDWLRLYLPSGVCGNTVIRLLTNLEHHFDARVGADVFTELRPATVSPDR